MTLIELTPQQLKMLLQEAAEIAAIHVLAQTGQIKPYLKKSEAFRKYGRKNVERWLNEGLITMRKDGDHSATWRISRLEIMAIAKSITLMRYL